MAVIQSNGTGGGLSNSTGTWAGGVIPAQGDKVTIVAGDTVTVNATHTWGDDTTTAVTVNETLAASRLVNSSLTFYGHCVISNTGTWDWGTSASPIPISVTATVLTNKSVAMSDGKYGIETNAQAKFFSFGASKTLQTISTAGGAAGTNTITVNDASNWAINDIITAQGTSASNQSEIKTIIGISGNVVTVDSNFTYTHSIGAEVVNVSTNVIYGNYSNSQHGYVYLYFDSTTPEGYREVQYSMFNYLGASSAVQKYGLTIYAANLNVTNKVFNAVSNNTFYRCYTSITFFSCPTVINLVADGNVSVQPSSMHYAWNAGAGTPLSNSVAINTNGATSAFYSAYSQGSQGTVIDTCRAYGCSYAVNIGNNIYIVFRNCTFNNNGNFMLHTAAAYALFDSCNIGAGSVGSPANTGAVFSNSAAALSNIIALNCNFQSSGSFMLNQQFSNPYNSIAIVNKNTDITKQEIWSKGGKIVRNNSTFFNGYSSIEFDTLYNYQISKYFDISASNGETITICGSIQYNSDFIAAGKTLPAVTISGLGITPVVFTAADSDTSQQKFILQATNTSGIDGTFTVTMNAQSATATGTVIFDGMPDPPFVTGVRHYGYTEDPANPKRTVDPYVVADYATASSMTGISLNYGTKTLTVTSNHSLQEIYDYTKYSDQLAANLTQPVTLTTTNGTSYTMASGWNIVINGATVSGTGTITTTGTYTQTSGGYFTGIIAASNGTTTQLQLTGLNGHTVYLADGSMTQQDFQASVTGTYTFYLPISATGTWTWVVKKPGYKGALGTFSATTGGIVNAVPSTPQDFQPSGSAMFQNTSDANCTVTFTGTTEADIVIGNATVLNQACYDTTENALVTLSGMKWLAGAKSDTSIATLLAGNFLFMTSGWRLKALNNACPNAAVGAFVISTDGTPVNGVNGPVAFLSSSQLTSQQVRDAMTLLASNGQQAIDTKLNAIIGLSI